MASGSIVIQIYNIMSTSGSYATIDIVDGGSTPAEGVPVYDFDAAVVEYIDMLCALNGYSGNGLDIDLPWSASSSTSGSVRWEVGIRAITDNAEDIGDAHSYSTNGTSGSAPTAIGRVRYSRISFTDGADMDNLSDGQMFILRILRDINHADDDMSGDAELWGIIGKET